MKNIRITAIVAAVAITASACGGSTGPTDEEARIAELEAQVEALAAEASTTEVPTTTVAPVKEVVATTAPPVKEEPEAEQAPETTEAPVEKSSDASDEDPDVLVDDTATAGSVAPKGNAITPTSSPDEMVTIIDDTRGPTDDLSATFNRIGTMPAFTTMPDTFVYDISYLVQNQRVWSDNPGGHRATSTVVFGTSALPQDVVLAYQTEFAAQGFGDIRTSEQAQEEVTFYSVSLGGFDEKGMWDVTAWSRDGDNFVELKYLTVSETPNEAAVQAVAGFAADTPVMAGAFLDDISIRAFSTGTIQLGAVYNGAGVTLAEAEAGHEARVAESGWTFDDMLGSTFQFTNAGDAGEWSVRYDGFDTSSTSSENSIRTVQWVDYKVRI